MLNCETNKVEKSESSFFLSIIEKQAQKSLMKTLDLYKYYREDRIRTCDTLVPNQVLYQAELLPDLKLTLYAP